MEVRETRRPRRPGLGALLFVLAFASCTAGPDDRPPGEAEARAVLEAAFSGASAARSGWVTGVTGDAGVSFRAARDAELAALWRPGPYEAVRIESMNCRFYPVWRVAFRPASARDPEIATGPVFVAELVPAVRVDGEDEGEGGDGPATGPDWRVLGRWWPAAATDGRAPDFRPRGRPAAVAGEGLFATAWPVWAVPARPDEGFDAGTASPVRD